MALGTRYPYGRRSDSGAPMNGSKFCDPLERLLGVDGELP